MIERDHPTEDCCDGRVNSTPHSFEFSIYVFSGSLAITTLGHTTFLHADHDIAVLVGPVYSLRAIDVPVKWLRIASPSEIDDGRRWDTFFTRLKLLVSTPTVSDMRDPRNQNAVRFDSDSMDLRRLAGSSDVEPPPRHPACRLRFLPTSGISVKMLIDQQHGAQLHTMFVVDDQPTAIAHPHVHPFAEAYVFSESEVHALVDGGSMVLRPGDVLWAGVGADRGLENRGSELVQ